MCVCVVACVCKCVCASVCMATSITVTDAFASERWSNRHAFLPPPAESMHSGLRGGPLSPRLSRKRENPFGCEETDPRYPRHRAAEVRELRAPSDGRAREPRERAPPSVCLAGVRFLCRGADRRSQGPACGGKSVLIPVCAIGTVL